MTQTKGVITKRMANKKDFNITGTGGKVANIPTPIPEAVIATPIAPKVEKPKPLSQMKKSELVDVALSRQIDVTGMTKKQILAVLE